MSIGKKRGTTEQAKVKALFAAGLAVSDISAKTGIPIRTIHDWKRKWIETDDEELAQLRIEQKNRFIEQAQRIIDKASNLIEIKIDKAVKSEREGQELLEQLERTLREAGASEEAIRSQIDELRKVVEKSKVDNLAQISTVLGTMYDKKALAEGKSTSNTSISIEGFIEKISGDSEF
jgi:transposase